MSSEGEGVIRNDQLLKGVFAALNHAETYYKDSKVLYEQGKFQSSIPLATISIEESMKAIELATNFRRGKDLSAEGWEKLTSHKHKLVHAFEDATSVMEMASDDSIAEAKKEMEESGVPVPAIAKKNLIGATKDKARIYSQFQELRESCFYTDWNEAESKWQIFPELSEERQKSLAFFVLSEAKSQLDFLHFTIEMIVNRLRRSGQLNDVKLPYPPYQEVRNPSDFMSIKILDSEVPKVDWVRREQGLAVMEKFIVLKSLEPIHLGLFSSVVLKYLDITRSNSNLNLHPMIKAMLISLSTAEKGGSDGNYAGMSGDANLTPDGAPSMTFVVVVSKKGETYTLQEFHCMADKDYTLPIELVEKIFRTEVLLEKVEGDNVPVGTYIEAMSVIGVKVKNLKDSEVGPAIELTRRMASKSRLEDVPPEIRKELLSARREDWDKLSSPARAIIACCYGQETYPDFNIFLTPTATVEKWKARGMIAQTLLSEFIKTA